MSAIKPQRRSATSIVTGEGLLSYCYVVEPRANMKGEEEYSVCFIWPKDDEATTQMINESVKAAADNKWPDPKSRPKGLRNPVRDGDEEKDEDIYAGCYFLNARNKKAGPDVVDERMQKITDPADCRSGDFGRVALAFYAYDNSGNRGVGVGLDAVQRTKRGEPLGGGAAKAADVFGVLTDAADDPLAAFI